MPESTAVQRIEQALSELTPGENARLLAVYPTLSAEALAKAGWAYAQLHSAEIAEQIAAHEAA